MIRCGPTWFDRCVAEGAVSVPHCACERLPQPTNCQRVLLDQNHEGPQATRVQPGGRIWEVMIPSSSLMLRQSSRIFFMARGLAVKAPADSPWPVRPWQGRIAAQDRGGRTMWMSSPSSEGAMTIMLGSVAM